MPTLSQNRRGLRMPLLPTGFDALCWGIIGQQINVKFASALRREIVELAGEKIGDMRAHPTPERVADIDVADPGGAALFPLQGALSDRCGAGGGRAASWISKIWAKVRPSPRKRR